MKNRRATSRTMKIILVLLLLVVAFSILYLFADFFITSGKAETQKDISFYSKEADKSQEELEELEAPTLNSCDYDCNYFFSKSESVVGTCKNKVKCGGVALNGSESSDCEFNDVCCCEVSTEKYIFCDYCIEDTGSNTYNFVDYSFTNSDDDNRIVQSCSGTSGLNIPRCIDSTDIATYGLSGLSYSKPSIGSFGGEYSFPKTAEAQRELFKRYNLTGLCKESELGNEWICSCVYYDYESCSHCSENRNGWGTCG